MILEQPTGELWLKTREVFNEEPDAKESYLAIIKEWLKQAPHLPSEFDEQCILNFLRGCKYSLEKTKRKLDMYFTMRTAVPELFTNRDINGPEIQEILSILQIPALPRLTPEGRRVTIFRGLDKDTQVTNVAGGFKLILMSVDVRLLEEKEGAAGDVYIFDATVATPTQFAKFSPTLMKKMFICIQEACPFNVKEIHIVNMSPFGDTIYSIVKHFMKQKIRERIFFHANHEDLHKYIPKEILPIEYGGTAGTMSDYQNAWIKKITEYKDWFAEQENVKADESLRPNKPTNYNELFGIEGSFRKLGID